MASRVESFSEKTRMRKSPSSLGWNVDGTIGEKNFKFGRHFDSWDTSPKVKWSRCTGFFKSKFREFFKYFEIQSTTYLRMVDLRIMYDLRILFILPKFNFTLQNGRFKNKYRFKNTFWSDGGVFLNGSSTVYESM